MKELKIQFTDEEAVMLTKIAKAKGMSVSSHVKSMALKSSDESMNEYGMDLIEKLVSKKKYKV